jgi:hypothetical protein
MSTLHKQETEKFEVCTCDCKCVHSALIELLRILNFNTRETLNEEALSCFDVINRQEIAGYEVLTAVPLESSLPECFVMITVGH